MSQRSRVSINSGLEQVRFQVERKQTKVENCAAQPSTGAGYSYQRFNNTSINLQKQNHLIFRTTELTATKTKPGTNLGRPV